MADEADFHGWLEPRAALSIVMASTGAADAAAEKALLAAISGDLITVGARTVVFEPMPPGGISGTTPILVPPRYWKFLIPGSSDFLSGYVAVAIEVSTGRNNRRRIVTSKATYFGLRLNPKQVREHFPRSLIVAPTSEKPTAAPDRPTPPKPPPSPEPSAPFLADVQTPTKGKPVSDHHLKAWAQVFRYAYPTGSEELAAKSAAGMFQEKSVPRAKLRAALAAVGKLPKGRPSKG